VTELLGVLAVLVACQYVVIAVFVVPRLSALANATAGYLTVAKWGAIAFFIGCAMTHTALAATYFAGDHQSDDAVHVLGHLVPHVAQLVGGAAFIWITRQHLEIKVVPRNVAHRLRDVEDRLKLALDASGLTTWEFDVAGGPDDLAGATTAGLIGGHQWSSSTLFDEIHADDHDMVMRRFHEALDAGRFEFEVRGVPVDDDSERWLEVTGTVYRSSDGSADRLAGTLADVTSRRAALHERAMLERQLQQSQRLDAVGRLAGGVAHDFNNLLQIIGGCAEIATDAAREGRSVTNELAAIDEAGRRGATLTRQLLTFSSDTAGDLVASDINAAVSGAIMMIERLIGDSISVAVVLDPDAGNVMIDPHQIGQVIMNLALNARDAMPTGGRLTIETVPVHLDRDSPALEGMKPGDYTMLAVSDTGVGMDPDVQRKIFDPFFTTKNTGEGTGLGLAVVHGIVRRSGGRISAYSEAGHGSVFKVYLPRVDTPTGIAPDDAFDSPGQGCILAVEDDPAVREVLVSMLTSMGYEVAAADGAEQAESMLTDRHDLVITDVMMPGTSGPVLAHRLRQRRPDLQVLFISGYTGTAMTGQSILGPDDTLLAKPFTLASLSLAVRRALLSGTQTTRNSLRRAPLDDVSAET
jgi:two-component system cell cycle sensor histidine kinase/response regulator CckA